ncbi:HalOD1 output domain-containing protein [Halorussus amylolyticus]|uniref:HalOD1 output domain-containing protein n=1 Tax=Halorussus amylolyticus TaxID=1126242 RepID=UPI00138F993D|nr:HalOD1 output domain-containing protein [Halorussus amylolyticus]
MATPRSAVDTNESVSKSIVETVAEVEGVSPTELTPPLYDVVDPDALDQLFAPASNRSDSRVVFFYNGYEVTVDGDGSVSVVRPDA